MTGLPYLADNIKSLLRWSLIVCLALFGLWLTWLLINFTYRLLIPPEPAGPNLAFGKLDRPFTYNANFATTSFSLDTPGDSLPIPSETLTVYAVLQLEGEFASLENAKRVAKSGGLDSEPFKLSESEWRFSDQNNPNKSLKFDIVTNNFLYQYDTQADPSALEGIFNTNEEKLVSKAQTTLKSFKSLHEDIENGTSRVTLYKIAGNNRNKVGSLSEANAAMVELFRQGITQEIPFVEINPDSANVTVLLSSSRDSEKQVLEVKFNYWGYLKDQTATYPPRTGEQAFEDLKSGKAYVATGAEDNFSSINITDVKLAYLNPNSDQSVIQPAYVFSGNGEINGEIKKFVAYVPAVSTDVVK